MNEKKFVDFQAFMNLGKMYDRVVGEDKRKALQIHGVGGNFLSGIMRACEESRASGRMALNVVTCFRVNGLRQRGGMSR